MLHPRARNGGTTDQPLVDTGPFFIETRTEHAPPPRVASPNCCKSPKSRQGNGVGSPKSCKTKKGDLRREKNATAVGGDRSPDRPAARRRSWREPAPVAV